MIIIIQVHAGVLRTNILICYALTCHQILDHTHNLHTVKLHYKEIYKPGSHSEINCNLIKVRPLFTLLYRGSDNYQLLIVFK